MNWNKQKQTDVLLYVNDGCALNDCYSIKCNKQQEKYWCFKAKICTLGGVGNIGIGPDRTGLDHGKSKKKKNIYELVINKK